MATSLMTYTDWLKKYPIQDLGITTVKRMVADQDEIAFEALQDRRNYTTKDVILETHVATALNNVFCGMLEVDLIKRYGLKGMGKSKS